MTLNLSKTTLRRSAICLGVVLIALFALRGVFLRAYAKHKVDQLHQRLGVVVSYDELRVCGLAGVEVSALSVVPIGGDTLLSATRIEASFSPLKMLIFQPDMGVLEAEDLHVSLVKRDSLNSNYDFIYRLRGTEMQSGGDSRNYARQVNRMARLLFDMMPRKAHMSGVELSYVGDGNSLVVQMPLLEVRRGAFKTQLQSIENGQASSWVVSGKLDGGSRRVNATIYSSDAGGVEVPMLEQLWGARIGFDTLSFGLSERMRMGQVTLQGEASVAGLRLHHWRVSPQDVMLDRGAIDYCINLGDNYMELDSSTVVRFNRLEVSPYLRAEHNDQWHFMASVNKQNFEADDLFQSLPRGLFSNLEGLRTKGKLSYHFLLDADLAQLDSLRLESKMSSDGLSILSYGKSDLRRMSGEFTYTAYDNDRAVSSFIVGPSNPDFCPLESVSPLLQVAVMQSEDGGFFFHNGFQMDYMRQALIHDIRERRFARGASTISMQLVKNVFLNRNKTIARKIEEALIVWLIEGRRLTSKQRMFEVYLNIVEWGPGVYGVRNAARYYFDKEPSQLDVQEVIFMAELIPHPKRALSSFDESLRLKPHYDGYYRLLAKRLEVKGAIDAQSAAQVKAEVTLRGAAREALLQRLEQRQSKSDTMAMEQYEPLF